MKKIYVIGVGLNRDDLSPVRLDLIFGAEVLAGGARLLEMFPEHTGSKLALKGGLEAWLDRIAEAARNEKVVVLASGDPGFFGAAAFLVRRFGQENVRTHPGISALQAAFARLNQPWEDVTPVSLHGRGWNGLWPLLRVSDRIALYTDPHNTPDLVARKLIDRGQKYWRMHVLEDLGQDSERMRGLSLDEAARAEFSPLNVVVLVRESEPAPLCLGTPDEAFVHEAGLITKAEVRAVALAMLSLKPGPALWDLGAGCGSVGLEATLLLGSGRVTAVEKNPDRVEMIQANRARFGAANLDIVAGEMPGALAGLDRPDRVFIGGGGADLAAIIRASAEALQPEGLIVVSAVGLASMETARRTLAETGFEVDEVEIQASRSRPLGRDVYLKALNPVRLIRGRRPG